MTGNRGRQRRGRSRGRGTRPDIELSASVKADELRFSEVPETDVRFSGTPGHRSSSGSKRKNLPEKVSPNTTYRDVQVDYRLASRIAAPRDEESDRGEEG